MPVERIGGDAERAIASVLAQDAPFPIRADRGLGATARICRKKPGPETSSSRIVIPQLEEIEQFPWRQGRSWPSSTTMPSPIRTGWPPPCAYLDEHPDVLALGGPDPAPPDSPVAELISDTLLATPWIGSGVAAHENRRGVFDVRARQRHRAGEPVRPPRRLHRLRRVDRLHRRRHGAAAKS